MSDIDKEYHKHYIYASSSIDTTYHKKYLYKSSNLVFVQSLKLGGEYIEMRCIQNGRIKWVGTSNEISEDFEEIEIEYSKK